MRARTAKPNESLTYLTETRFMAILGCIRVGDFAALRQVRVVEFCRIVDALLDENTVVVFSSEAHEDEDIPF